MTTAGVLARRALTETCGTAAVSAGCGMLTWKPRTLAGHAKEGIGAVNYSASVVRVFLFEQLIKLVELPWVQMRQMW